MRKNLFSIIVLLVFSGCLCEYSTDFESKSSRNLFVNAEFGYGKNNLAPMDSANCLFHSELLERKRTWMYWGSATTIKGTYSHGTRVFQIFVFDHDTILKYGYKTCRDKNMILARYDIPKNRSVAIYKKFRTLYYPPTPAMRDAGIGIYLSEERQKDMEEAQ